MAYRKENDFYYARAAKRFLPLVGVCHHVDELGKSRSKNLAFSIDDKKHPDLALLSRMGIVRCMYRVDKTSPTRG